MADVLETIKQVEVRTSPINGRGLFTTRAREKGEVLTVLDGQVLRHDDDLGFLLQHEWNAVSDDEILLRPVWTSYGFINHAKNGIVSFNLLTRALFVTCDVAAQTELTLDYLEHGIPKVYLNSDHGAYLR